MPSVFELNEKARERSEKERASQDEQRDSKQNDYQQEVVASKSELLASEAYRKLQAVQNSRELTEILHFIWQQYARKVKSIGHFSRTLSEPPFSVSTMETFGPIYEGSKTVHYVISYITELEQPLLKGADGVSTRVILKVELPQDKWGEKASDESGKKEYVFSIEVPTFFEGDAFSNSVTRTQSFSTLEEFKLWLAKVPPMSDGFFNDYRS